MRIKFLFPERVKAKGGDLASSGQGDYDLAKEKEEGGRVTSGTPELS